MCFQQELLAHCTAVRSSAACRTCRLPIAGLLVCMFLPREQTLHVSFAQAGVQLEAYTPYGMCWMAGTLKCNVMCCCMYGTMRNSPSLSLLLLLITTPLDGRL